MISSGYKNKNINVCKHCGRTNEKPAETNWYWVDVLCSICSRCAVGRGVMIRIGCYTRPVGDSKTQLQVRRRNAR